MNSRDVFVREVQGSLQIEKGKHSVGNGQGFLISEKC